MKKFGTLVTLVVLSLVIYLFVDINKNVNTKTTYSGIVVDKSYQAPTSGYKSYTESEYNIFMRENITHKVIRVRVNVPTYYSLKKGDKTKFSLSNMAMYALGNQPDSNKNFYGK
jgi:nitrogen fixation protein FixH